MIMRVKKILVSQPEPSSEKSPYNRLKEKLNFSITLFDPKLLETLLKVISIDLIK